MSTVELGPEHVAGWVDGGDDETPVVRWAAGVLGVMVRLWCLPLLLVFWVLGWAAIGTIRGMGAVATLCVGSSRAGHPSPGRSGAIESTPNVLRERAMVSSRI